MIRRTVNGVIWLIGFSVLLGVYFFIPVGRRTLYEHTLRIAATEPARELGDDLSRASKDLAQRAAQEWEARRTERQSARRPTSEGAEPTSEEE